MSNAAFTTATGLVLAANTSSDVDCYGYRFRLVEQACFNRLNQRMWFADDTVYEAGQCGPYATKKEAVAASRKNGLRARAWGAGLGKKGPPLTHAEIAKMADEHAARCAGDRTQHWTNGVQHDGPCRECADLNTFRANATR